MQGNRDDHLIENLLIYLAGRSRRFVIVAASIVALVTGIPDYLLRPQIGFSILYLVPITIAAWYAGLLPGMFVACVGTTAWLVSDELAGTPGVTLYTTLWNAMVRLGFFTIIVALLNGFKREKSFAREDSLTGLGNRRFFFERADEEIQRAKRYEHPFSMAYIDIDDLKFINDRYGHAEGDVLLKDTGRTIAGHIRKTDIAARLGGDEFAVLIPESSDEAAKLFFSKLRELLSGATHERPWPATFSIGVVTFNKPPESIDEMIRIVDRLMYSAKKGGKNLVKYEIYETK